VKNCSIWYDEPRLLAAVRTRLAMPADARIPVMACAHDAPTATGRTLPFLFSLPEEIAALGTVYGEGGAAAAEGSAAAATSAKHVAAIRTAVENLAGMEVRAQALYLALKGRFLGGAGGE
jgi:hypothetical protein